MPKGWGDRVSGNKYCLILDEWSEKLPNQNYARMYIPYETFAAAAKQVYELYNNNNSTLVGYQNFMKYWAKNGDFDWIGSMEEYKDMDFAGTFDVKSVQLSWSRVPEWVAYDGTIDALGRAFTGGEKAVGW